MIFIEIRCDKCQTVGISRHCFYAHQLRQELKGQGWKYIEAGGKDFCPKHKPRRKPRRRSRTRTCPSCRGTGREGGVKGGIEPCSPLPRADVPPSPQGSVFGTDAVCTPPVSAGGMFCPDCDGVGRIPERREDVYCDPEHECSFCQGTGRVLRDHKSTTYYHGGPEGLTEVLPPSVTGMPSCADYDDTGVIRRDRVYIITVAGEAEDFAMFAPTRGDVCVYEVVPVGAVEPDPDCLVPGVSFCCEAARVVRVVKHISSSSRHRALGQTTGEAI